MADKIIIPKRNVPKSTRVLNELEAKIENEEKLDGIVEARGPDEQSLFDRVSFDCECDDKTCDETISMSTEEFKRIHRKTNIFVVFPSHVHLDIEEVLSTFSEYVTVAKILPPTSA